MKKLILILCFMVLLLCGCKTTNRDVYYPDFRVITPSRPNLETVNENVPIEASRNLIKMISYAEQLENALTAWNDFYTRLQND